MVPKLGPRSGQSLKWFVAGLALGGWCQTGHDDSLALLIGGDE